MSTTSFMQSITSIHGWRSRSRHWFSAGSAMICRLAFSRASPCTPARHIERDGARRFEHDRRGHFHDDRLSGWRPWRSLARACHLGCRGRNRIGRGALLSELAVNFPRSGWEYVYLSEAWGRMWGFIDGWVSFFAGFSAPVAAAALAISAYLAYFFPVLQIDSAVDSSVAGLQVGGGQIVASAIVAVFTAFNLFGVSQVAKLQNVLTVTKLTRHRNVLDHGLHARYRRLVALFRTCHTHVHEQLGSAIREQSGVCLLRLQRMERGRLCGGRNSRSRTHLADRARVWNARRFVAVCRLERAVHLRERAGGHEGCRGCGSACRNRPLRRSRRWIVQRCNGRVIACHSQCDVDDRPARVPCDGTRRRVLCRSRESAFALAYPLGSLYSPRASVRVR